MPRNHAELHDVLASFAARHINLLVIDGGDGTVRDVISAAKRHFRHAFPRLAVVPSGKTNALALDLGIPNDWTITSALEAAHSGRVGLRSPIEISRRGESQTPIRGFLFGTGAFLRATALAQKTHRIGAFNGLAVGLSIAGSVAQTAFGGRDNVWRRGDMLRIEWQDGRVVEQPHYLALASTLMRLPTGIKPFGRVRDGLKLLTIDAPPRRLLTSVPTLLRGSEAASLERDGYHRTDVEQVGLTIETGFVLDGEAYPGGDLVLRRGDPIRFVVP